jgi:hypothetical protein
MRLPYVVRSGRSIKNYYHVITLLLRGKYEALWAELRAKYSHVIDTGP